MTANGREIGAMLRAPEPGAVAEVDEHVGEVRHGQAMQRRAAAPSAGASRIQLSVIAGRASMWST